MPFRTLHSIYARKYELIKSNYLWISSRDKVSNHFSIIFCDPWRQNVQAYFGLICQFISFRFYSLRWQRMIYERPLNVPRTGCLVWAAYFASSCFIWDFLLIVDTVIGAETFLLLNRYQHGSGYRCNNNAVENEWMSFSKMQCSCSYMIWILSSMALPFLMTSCKNVQFNLGLHFS